MPLKLCQFVYEEGKDNGLVTPLNDATFYQFLARANTMLVQATVTQVGTNQLRISYAMGVAHGHLFVVTEEPNLSIPVSPSGTIQGRLAIRIDTSDSTNPISWLPQQGNSLPALIQEDLLNGGSVFEVPVATYTVGETSISGVVATPMINHNLMYMDEYDNNRDGRVDRAEHATLAANSDRLGNQLPSFYLPASYFQWIEQSSQPVHLWGGNAPNQYRAYRTATLRVGYATTAGTIEGIGQYNSNPPYDMTNFILGFDGQGQPLRPVLSSQLVQDGVAATHVIGNTVSATALDLGISTLIFVSSGLLYIQNGYGVNFTTLNGGSGIPLAAAAYNIYSTSDIKENIQDIGSEALARILKLKPSEFDLKREPQLEVPDITEEQIEARAAAIQKKRAMSKVSALNEEKVKEIAQAELEAERKAQQEKLLKRDADLKARGIRELHKRGFVVEELEKVSTDYVSYDENGKATSYDPACILADAVATIQNLEGRIRELESKVEELSTK